ncbi:MAG: HlyD family secretion protein [Candidatus Rokubacteria bacterium]|nr:HlyD family secretion protein [Candidatus Rokubacteria bacterium]
MRVRLLAAAGVLAGLASLAYGGWVWHWAVTYVWTDDAYVEGTISPISAKVAGHVTELLVRDNQPVRQGDLLLRIDRRDFQAKADQARAAVATAEANLRAARSDVPLTRETTRAQVDQSRAGVESSVVGVRGSESAVEEGRARLEARRAATAALRAEVGGAEATHRQAARELARARTLHRSDLVARRDLDLAEAAAETAAAAVEAARRRLAQAEREIQQAEADLAVRAHAVDQARQRVAESRAGLARSEGQLHQVAIKDAEVTRAEARLREARADLAFVELQLAHTEVRAPLDGVVSKRSVEVGQVVQMGQPLLAIVPLHEVWVVANFKETQLARLRPGMTASVHVDGAPGKAFTGTVDSISAGTGARFSLLPPENATGNWVKVVQRVPVKIRLDAREPGNPLALRAGMSAAVTIRVR